MKRILEERQRWWAEQKKAQREPVIMRDGRTQEYYDKLDVPERFNFLPYVGACNCGEESWVYSAFMMADGRQTVMKICRACGKQSMLKKVRLVAETDEEGLKPEVVEALLEDMPSMVKVFERTKFDVQMRGDRLIVRMSADDDWAMKLLKRRDTAILKTLRDWYGDDLSILLRFDWEDGHFLLSPSKSEMIKAMNGEGTITIDEESEAF